MSTKNSPMRFEIETAPGIESITENEIIENHMPRLTERPKTRKGVVNIRYRGNPQMLLGLKTVVAIYSLETYDIPRPKAFLGHEHITRLLKQIELARSTAYPSTFETLYINAAGSDSSVMQRLLDELAKSAKLKAATEEGDMVLRIRRSKDKKGWDVLVRLTPRPLSTRTWRVANLPGALNASVAHAMVRLSEPKEDDVVLNVACGSASLAIERRAYGKAKQIIAADNNLDVIEMAMANIEAAGYEDDIETRVWDVKDIPMSTNSVDAAFADLPFGNHVGSHKQNEVLYPHVLSETARVIKRDGRFVVITHEIRLMDTLLDGQDKWLVERILPITLSGLHPRIYVLKRL